MKKVLFLMQSYPAQRSANVRCDQKIIEELLSTENYEIHCQTFQYYNQKLFEEIDSVKVHRVKKSCFWNLYTWAKNDEQTIKFKIIEKLNRIFLRIKQLFTIPIYPFYEPISCRKYMRAALRLHKKEKFDIIIAEHHGLENVYAGHKIKEKYPDTKFVSILWDPFTGKSLAKYLPKKYAESKLLKAEAKILSNADKIIAMASSKSYHQENSIHKPYYSKYVFLDIPNIKKPESSEGDPLFIEKDKINVVFSGVLSCPERDPEYIVNLLNLSKNADRMNLIFLCTGDGRDKLSKLNKSFKGNIVINGYVPQEQLRCIYHNADILLNLGGSNPYMVPSKIFEYMSYGKPIISTYYIDNETSKGYFSQYPLALCVDQRIPVETSTAMIDVFLDEKLGQVIPFEEVEEQFNANTPKAYVEVVEQLMEDSDSE